jgi:hypothetical protein
MSSKVYFTEGASTTKAGLQKFVSENQHKEIIIIDKIDKMSRKIRKVANHHGTGRIYKHQSQKHKDCKGQHRNICNVK